MSESSPFDTRDEAAAAGFRQVLQNGDQSKIEEFGFWVIVKLNKDKKPKFHHTAIESSRSHDFVRLAKPRAVIVRAHCHSHPISAGTENFSPGDKGVFEELNKDRNSNIVCYLMTPLQQIRLAERKQDFPVGRDVRWV
jgi:hypothetical protein